jgi:hypothetical protein
LTEENSRPRGDIDFVRSIYDRLRTLEEGGEKIISGHTTVNGQMAILNYSKLDAGEVARRIDRILGGEYAIDVDNRHAWFPSKEEYGYASDRSSGNGAGASAESPLRTNANHLRNEASSAFDDAYTAGKIPERIYRASRRDAISLGAEDSGSRPQGQPRQSGTGSEGSVEQAPPTLVEQVVDAVSRLFGREEPAQPVQETPSLKADTPEQAAALDISARNPDALIPTGELDAEGNPVYARASDLMAKAEAIENQAKTDSAAFEVAMKCSLRY